MTGIDATAGSVTEGRRYRAKADVAVTCLTSWAAPYTGGYDRVLPRGAVVVVETTPPAGATAVDVVPLDYDGLHAGMVPLYDRWRFWVYRGYWLSIPLGTLERDFEPLDAGSAQARDRGAP